MKKYSAQKILNISNKYYQLATSSNDAIKAFKISNSSAALLALPIISDIIRDTLLDNARSIRNAVNDLNQKWENFDKYADTVSGDELFSEKAKVQLYKENMPRFKEFRQKCSKLANLYDIVMQPITNLEEKEKQIDTIEDLTNEISRKGESYKLIISDSKHVAIKAIESLENFGLTFGFHNNMREIEEAIDRLNQEISKSEIKIDDIKKEIEKRKSESAGAVAQLDSKSKPSSKDEAESALTQESESADIPSW